VLAVMIAMSYGHRHPHQRAAALSAGQGGDQPTIDAHELETFELATGNHERRDVQGIE
jgi:hypothetical protein